MQNLKLEKVMINPSDAEKLTEDELATIQKLEPLIDTTLKKKWCGRPGEMLTVDVNIDCNFRTLRDREAYGIIKKYEEVGWHVEYVDLGNRFHFSIRNNK